MNFTIEAMPKQRIAFFRNVGPYGESNRAVMEKLKTWAASKDLLKEEAIILGIAWDDMRTTPPENCRYDACIVISDEYKIDDEAVKDAELPGGAYAVFTIPHTAETVQQAWAEMFPALSSQGQNIDFTRPILERYIPCMINRNLCEICVPV